MVTELEVRAWMAAGDVSAVQYLVRENISELSPEVLVALLDWDGEDWVTLTLGICLYAQLPLRVMEVACSHQRYEIRVNVALRHDLPVDLMERLLVDPNKRVRGVLAQRVPSERVQAAFAGDVEPWVVESLIANPSLHDSVAQRLSHHSSPSLRRLLAKKYPLERVTSDFAAKFVADEEAYPGGRQVFFPGTDLEVLDSLLVNWEGSAADLSETLLLLGR